MGDEQRPPSDEVPERPRPEGRPSTDPEPGLRPPPDPSSKPTVAPEEEGGTPATEHAPGGDL